MDKFDKNSFSTDKRGASNSPINESQTRKLSCISNAASLSLNFTLSILSFFNLAISTNESIIKLFGFI